MPTVSLSAPAINTALIVSERSALGITTSFRLAALSIGSVDKEGYSLACPMSKADADAALGEAELILASGATISGFALPVI